MALSYGVGYCKQCGKKFEVKKRMQFYCSEQCRTNWIKRLSRRRYYLEEHWLNCQLEHYIAQFRKEKAQSGQMNHDLDKQEIRILELDQSLLQIQKDNSNLRSKCECLEAEKKALETVIENLRKQLKSNSDTNKKETTSKSAQSTNEEEIIGSGKFRHICSNCGTTFKSTYKNSKFCCEQCKHEANSLAF